MYVVLLGMYSASSPMLPWLRIHVLDRVSVLFARSSWVTGRGLLVPCCARTVLLLHVLAQSQQ